MKETILPRLREIERRRGVRILYACESGSRAWGFQSADSDWDVRFIYVHPRDWYLSIGLEGKRDVIEERGESGLDISGWDVRKALALFRKSNPPLMEWLGSPIVYIEDGGFSRRMRELKSRYYSYLSARFHYLHMAQGNYREYLRGGEVWLKKYFYVLRPLLAVKWIDELRGPVPTPFLTLVDGLLGSGLVREEILNLIETKRAGSELGWGARNPVISRFIEEEFARTQTVNGGGPPESPPIGELNAFFQSLLE